MSQQWIRRNPAVGFLFPALTRPKRSIGSTTAPHIQPVVPEPTSEWLVTGEVVLTKILTHLSSKNQRGPLWNPQTSTNWLTKQKHGSLSSHQLRPSKTGLKNNEDDADCTTCVLRSLAQLISPLPLHQQCAPWRCTRVAPGLGAPHCWWQPRQATPAPGHQVTGTKWCNPCHTASHCKAVCWQAMCDAVLSSHRRRAISLLIMIRASTDTTRSIHIVRKLILRTLSLYGFELGSLSLLLNLDSADHYCLSSIYW